MIKIKKETSMFHFLLGLSETLESYFKGQQTFRQDKLKRKSSGRVHFLNLKIILGPRDVTL